jgi:hypothetical protein
MDIRSICTRGTIAAALAAMLAALSACGDNDAAGSKTAFSTVPSEIAWAGATATTCGSGTVLRTRIFVYGGAGPYRIDNTAPNGITVVGGQTNVSGPGGYFEIEPVAGGPCPFTGQIVVVDELRNLVTIEVTNDQGS